MFDHLITECTLREVAPAETLGSFGKCVRYARQVLSRIDVAAEVLRRFGAIHNPVQPRCQRRRERQVRIAVRPGETAFDAEAFTVADDPESGGAVVATPGETGWRPRSIDVPLVRVHRG